MKHIRNSFIAIFLAVSGFAFALIAEPNFELWNKHNDPLYYSMSNSPEEASHKKFEECAQANGPRLKLSTQASQL